MREEVAGPRLREEQHGVAFHIGGLFRAGREQRVINRRVVLRGGPAQDLPRRVVEARLRAVLTLHPKLHDLELQRPDRAEQRHALRRVFDEERLHHAFLQQLVETFAKAFELRGARTLQPREDFRREARNLLILQRRIDSERVADAEVRVSDESDDIAGERLVHSLAVTAEKFVRAGEPNFFPRARVRDAHVALELAGADTDEGEPVAVLRVHVRLNLEDKAGEAVGDRIDHAVVHGARLGRRRQFEESVEQHFHAEVVHGAAEEDGRELAREHLRVVERSARALEHRQFIHDLGVHIRVHRRAHDVIGKIMHGHRRAILARDHALEEMHQLGLAIIHAAKFLAVAERPVHRIGVNAQHAFQFVQQRQRIARGPVQLVHEREDGHAALAANFKQFARLALDAFARVNDHDRRVHCRQHAVGILGEIFVAGRVEQVHAVAAILELQHGRTDRDAALALQFHPVGRGGALVLVRGDGTGQLHGAAVEQELLGQRRLARVRMRNDRKRPAARNLLFD